MTPSNFIWPLPLILTNIDVIICRDYLVLRVLTIQSAIFLSF